MINPILSYTKWNTIFYFPFAKDNNNNYEILTEADHIMGCCLRDVLMLSADIMHVWCFHEIRPAHVGSFS